MFRPVAKPRQNLLLCFDAFNTLYAPRQPVAVQYAAAARAHGLSGFEVDDVALRLKKAMKEEHARHPNYGKNCGLKSPNDWWANIIRDVFEPFVPTGQELPSQLIPSLLHRFSSSEGYTSFADVHECFDVIRTSRKNNQSHRLRPNDKWKWQKTVIGVISNSDNRVADVLGSIGLSVAAESGLSAEQDASTERRHDIDLVALSYDVGYEKPSARIFDAARKMFVKTLERIEEDPEEYELLFVGDDVEQDVVAATDAGWNAVLIDRDLAGEGPSIRRVPLSRYLEHSERSDVQEINVIRSLLALQDWRPRDWHQP